MVFSTMTPASDPCALGGTSMLMELAQFMERHYTSNGGYLIQRLYMQHELEYILNGVVI